MTFILAAAATVAIFLRARHYVPSGIAPLTSLRAFAAAMVFMLHFGTLYRVENSNLLSYFMRGGYEGVTIFFVLSGFLLTMTIRRDIKALNFKVGGYFLRRAARIYPLYYILLAITFVLDPAVVHWQHVVLLQGFFPSAVYAGIPPAWTLTVEESFYLLLPVIMWTCRRFGKSNGLVLWTIGLIVSGFVLLALNIPDFLALPQFLWSQTIFGRFPVFAIGIACAFWYERRKQWPLLLLFLSVIGVVIGTYAAGLQSESPDFRLPDLVVALSAGGLILGLVSDNRVARWLGNRYLAYLGVVSYALYLVQLTPGLAWLKWAVHTLPQIALAYAAVTLFAMLCYELIEHPARLYILNHTRAESSMILASQSSS